MPLVSVIVPIYNVAPYLEQCVASLTAQTLSQIEIILVDDESPDDCPALCDALARSDPRIQVIHQENAGVSAARNAGMERAAADWVLFVDGDDWLEPHALEVLYGAATPAGCDIVVGSYFINSPAGQRGEFARYSRRLDFYAEPTSHLLPQVFTCKPMKQGGGQRLSAAISYPWGSLYRRSYLVQHHIRFIPGLKRMQDMIFNLYAVYHAAGVLYVDAPLYHYRTHAGSVCRRLFPDQTEIYRQIIGEMKSFLSVSQGSEPLQQAYFIRILGMCTELCRLLAHSGMERREQTQILRQFAEQPDCKQALRTISPHALGPRQRILLSFFRTRQYGLLLGLLGAFERYIP